MQIVEYGSFFSLGIFFIFILPVCIAAYYEKPLKYCGMILSIPLLYVLTSEHIVRFIAFLALESFLVWFYCKIRQKYSSKMIFVICLFLSLLPLIYTRTSIYTGWKSIECIGMSYIGFRVWQLLIDIYDGRIKKINFIEMMYFISFFPTLSSGPIDRFERFKEDLCKYISRKEYFNNYFLVGLGKIGYGIMYKFAIANTINVFFLNKINCNGSVFDIVKYMYGYTAYLFFDFAGYSLFAIGFSYLIGIKTPENFNKPFLARNMKEFWERWHISLSRWLGDYVFNRFVLWLIRSGIVKKQYIAARYGSMLTMLLMGIWHGFTGYYILYGLYQGLALVLTDIYQKSKSYRSHLKNPYYNVYSRIICFHIVAFGLLLFSGKLISF